MGGNLALNIADHGFRITIFGRTKHKIDAFVGEHPPESLGSKGGALDGTSDYKELVARLERPRAIILLIPAGAPTDDAISHLRPLLDKGDIIIDGGNAFFADTQRRQKELEPHGIHLLGSGVSGGEVGARFGPSLMAGGPKEAWDAVEPIWTAIAAKVDASGKAIEGGEPGVPIEAPGAESCAAYIGPGGSGHYVKMVHNGIEYADMQFIAEAYELLRASGMEPRAIADVFAKWDDGPLDSYLIEITADILRTNDPETGKPFVDVVLDAAGQKGTGKWTSIDALDRGVAAPSIAESVFARAISAVKEERVEASEVLQGPGSIGRSETLVNDVHDALLCSKIVAYAQGFALIGEASREEGWGVDFGTLARIWRGGCIIRARLLEQIRAAYAENPSLPNLLLAPSFAAEIKRRQAGWRRAVSFAAIGGVPTPGFSTSLAYYDSYRSARLPASLIQAQRDYFGSHTYERVDQPRGKKFHLEWTHDPRTQTEW